MQAAVSLSLALSLCLSLSLSLPPPLPPSLYISLSNALSLSVSLSVSLPLSTALSRPGLGFILLQAYTSERERRTERMKKRDREIDRVLVVREACPLRVYSIHMYFSLYSPVAGHSPLPPQRNVFMLYYPGGQVRPTLGIF